MSKSCCRCSNHCAMCAKTTSRNQQCVAKQDQIAATPGPVAASCNALTMLLLLLNVLMPLFFRRIAIVALTTLQRLPFLLPSSVVAVLVVVLRNHCNRFCTISNANAQDVAPTLCLRGCRCRRHCHLVYTHTHICICVCISSPLACHTADHTWLYVARAKARAGFVFKEYEKL